MHPRQELLLEESKEEASRRTRHDIEGDFENDQNELSAHSTEEEEDEERGGRADLEAHGLQGLKDFLLGSETYTLFTTQALEFAHRPYEIRILTALGNELYSDLGVKLNEVSKKAVSVEISWVLSFFTSRQMNASLV